MDTSSQSKTRKLSQVSGDTIESLKAEVAKLKELIVNQAVKINELESSPPNEDDMDEDMEAEMDRLKEIDAKLRAELDETQTKMEEERKRHEAEIAALNSAAITRDREIRELEEQISVLKDVKVDFGTKNDTLKEERAAFQLNINKMKVQVDKLTQKNAEGEAQAEEARQKIDARDKEISELKKQLSSTNDVKNDMEKLKNDKSQVDDLTKKKCGLDAKNAKKSAAEYEKKINELEDQLQKTKNEMKQKEDIANATISFLKKRNSELKDQPQREKNAASTSRDFEFQESGNNVDLWITECRIVGQQILNKETRTFLCEGGEEIEENMDEIAKKFRERKYKSPNEFHAALTNLIDSCFVKNYGRSFTAKRQFLITLKETMNDKFKPIIEKFTQMKNGQRNIRPRRSAAIKAPSAWQGQLEYL